MGKYLEGFINKKIPLRVFFCITNYSKALISNKPFHILKHERSTADKGVPRRRIGTSRNTREPSQTAGQDREIPIHLRLLLSK